MDNIQELVIALSKFNSTFAKEMQELKTILNGVISTKTKTTKPASSKPVKSAEIRAVLDLVKTADGKLLSERTKTTIINRLAESGITEIKTIAILHLMEFLLIKGLTPEAAWALYTALLNTGLRFSKDTTKIEPTLTLHPSTRGISFQAFKDDFNAATAGFSKLNSGSVAEEACALLSKLKDRVQTRANRCQLRKNQTNPK